MWLAGRNLAVDREVGREWQRLHGSAIAEFEGL
jgi:hypothetical protein